MGRMRRSVLAFSNISYNFSFLAAESSAALFFILCIDFPIAATNWLLNPPKLRLNFERVDYCRTVRDDRRSGRSKAPVTATLPTFAVNFGVGFLGPP